MLCVYVWEGAVVSDCGFHQQTVGQHSVGLYIYRERERDREIERASILLIQHFSHRCIITATSTTTVEMKKTLVGGWVGNVTFHHSARWNVAGTST